MHIFAPSPIADRGQSDDLPGDGIGSSRDTVMGFLLPPQARQKQRLAVTKTKLNPTDATFSFLLGSAAESRRQRFGLRSSRGGWVHRGRPVWFSCLGAADCWAENGIGGRRQLFIGSRARRHGTAGGKGGGEAKEGGGAGGLGP
ncbi:unnamed protein product [Linum trigynum]|uniref:Uncharacterized protein n=1 Tax=Linum trigynum TaxID=586398 RepID=A0AAV2FUA4_9ROSI